MADKIKIRILNKTEILAYWIVSCTLCEGFKLWLLGSWWNISKNKNGGQEVTWSSNQRIREKKKEIIWVNLKVGEKRREKAFLEEVKTFEQKKLYNY